MNAWKKSYFLGACVGVFAICAGLSVCWLFDNYEIHNIIYYLLTYMFVSMIVFFWILFNVETDEPKYL